MAYGTVNADVIGTSVAGSNLGAGNASIMKNRIINGAMVIDQRNAGASVTPNNSYTLDRWYYQNSQTSKATVQQSSTAPAGFTNSLLVTSSSAYSVGTSDYFALVQLIEGFNVGDLNFGSANAKTITLSFWVRSSLTGTFGGVVSNGTDARSYPFTYTILSANTWTQASVTIAGDQSGTWATNNSAGMKVYFGLGCGSSLSATAGSWTAGNYISATGATSVVGTSGATFYITGVQLEVGSSATGFEYVNYQTSLANCQRYYEFGNLYATGYGNGTNAVQFSYPMKVSKRATPTGTVTDVNSTNYSSISFVGNDANSVYTSGTASSGFTRAIVSVTITAEL